MKYTETMHAANLKAISDLAREVGGFNLRFKLIDGWGADKGEVPSISFGRRNDVTLAQKVDAILEHLGIEIVPGPKVVIKQKAELDKP